jgi:hypothetical protein
MTVVHIRSSHHVTTPGTMGAMNPSNWSHRSFTPPFTTSGRAALVPPPPWHYAGWSHPEEDIGVLGDIQATEASVGWIGITVAGARDA